MKNLILKFLLFVNFGFIVKKIFLSINNSSPNSNENFIVGLEYDKDLEKLVFLLLFFLFDSTLIIYIILVIFNIYLKNLLRFYIFI